ncbi:ABC transporter permease [Persicitalea jodogahamensis]|uniref:ABC transporter permease n=1 Tax=Persicitalea jodogahamensis TaxID=402147 RepID=A0A8J3GCC5_9BACT|nr:ABC transporter permease [Persicitalea jodogahamensis]GHB83676.1 ABC transporter permease [Persicitalea jodogahamensis]
MLRNYLKIAFRNLIRNKGYSFINIGGLAVGMTVAMLIGLWVYDELSYDRSFDNYDRIALVMQNQTFNGEIQAAPNVPKLLAPELRDSYGDNFEHIVISSFNFEQLLAVGDKKITKTGNYMGPEAPEMLTLQMRKGTRAGLTETNSIMLSESTAQALFGEADPLGKIVKLNNREDVEVTGVYADLPYNSSFRDLTFIAPWELNNKNLPPWLGWGNNWFLTYAQIAENTTMADVSAKIKNAKFNKVGEEEKKFKAEIFLQPMKNWYLRSEFENGIQSGGRIEYVWLFGIIGIFVLLLACINFMNLSTARSEKRAREVGLRKAVGSMRGQLITQFFGESLLVVVLAFVLAVFLVLLGLPAFNEVTDKQIVFPWASPVFWWAGFGFVLFTGLFAGSYPALYLSSFSPIKTLKGTIVSGRFASMPRKALVVVQFTVSVTLIIGTIIVYQQIQHAKNRPIGYDRSNLITIPMKSGEIKSHYEAFREEILSTGAVQEMTATDSPITFTYITNGGLDWKGKDPNMGDEFVSMRVTPEFGKTIGWQIKEGRDFDKNFASDSTALVINEEAVRYMGLENPVGEIVRWQDMDFRIIGVVKNLVTQSPYEPVKQTIFFVEQSRNSLLSMKLNPGMSATTSLSKVEAVYKKFDPVNPFKYTFAEEDFAIKFAAEERIGTLAAFFAGLAILISCLGLFGMASYVAEQRTKEIGVRKVLGASVASLWRLLSKDFVLLVVIALLIAAPLAWYFMEGWLQKYAYRTELSWWIFAAAGAGALVITLLTVSFQAVKAALMNPVNSLRSE